MRLLFSILFVILFFGCSSESGDDNPDNTPIVCNVPTTFNLTGVELTSITISWSGNNSSTFEIEYGELGFIQGQGQVVTASGTTKTITNLESDTGYQFYFRSNCGGNNFSSWVGPRSYTTASIPCHLPVPYLMTSLSSNSKLISWTGSPEVDSYTIEFGIAGFTIGNGQTITTTETSAVVDYVAVAGFYQLYLRSNCQDDATSNWVGPLNFISNGSDCGASNFTAVPVTNDIYTTYLNWGVTWTPNHSPDSWYIEYGPSGFELGNGTSITTSNGSLGYVIEDMTPSTTYDFYIKGNCGNGGASIFTGFISYTTPD